MVLGYFIINLSLGMVVGESDCYSFRSFSLKKIDDKKPDLNINKASMKNRTIRSSAVVLHIFNSKNDFLPWVVRNLLTAGAQLR